MDQKISIWKRFGGWLRGSISESVNGNSEVPELGNDGLLLEPEVPCDHAAPASTSIFSRHPKKNQLAAVEESFTRLVEMLETINESVIQQRDVSAQLAQYVKELPDLSSIIPQAIDDQKDIIKEVAQQVQNQSLHYQEVMEILKDLPELTQSQITQLQAIAQQLHSTAKSDEKMAGSFQRMESTMQQTLDANKSQQQSLNILEDLLAKNEQRTETLIKSHNRRFGWLVAVVVLAVVVFGGTAGVILWLILQKLNLPPA